MLPNALCSKIDTDRQTDRHIHTWDSDVTPPPLWMFSPTRQRSCPQGLAADSRVLLRDRRCTAGSLQVRPGGDMAARCCGRPQAGTRSLSLALVHLVYLYMFFYFVNTNTTWMSWSPWMSLNVCAPYMCTPGRCRIGPSRPSALCLTLSLLWPARNLWFSCWS